MKKILSMLMALATAVGPTPAWAALEQEVDVKVQQRTQKTFKGGRSAQPEEYGEIPNGVILEKYRLDYQNENYVLDVEASNVGQNNQSLEVEGGQPGKMMWKVLWDSMPHLYSNEARTPFVDSGNGILRLPGAYRPSDLQTGSTWFTSHLGGALPYTPLGLDINTGKIDLRFHPGHDFTIETGVMRQTKTGTKATTASFGFSNAIELAAPIDQTTYEAYLDMQKATSLYQMAFGYRLSDFQNNIPNLYWDNPYRRTDRYSSSSGYSSGDQSKGGAQAMEPNNTVHSLKVEGGVNLPGRTRVSGEAGYQLWKANNPMLPYTTNTSIKSTSAQAVKPSFDASAMGPDDDVVGKIEVYTYMGKVAARPFDWLKATLSHEAYILENMSKQYTLPGWAVFDQVWHAETKTTPREQFRDDKTALAFDYDIFGGLSGSTGLKHIYKKQTREIPKLREYEVEQGLSFRPHRNLFVNVSGLHGERRGSGMDLEHYPRTTTVGGNNYFTEHPGLRRIDVADRNRNQGRVQVQWTPGEASFSASARVTDDKYRLGKGDPTGGYAFIYPGLYGTQSEQAQAYGVDFSVPVLGDLVVDGFYEYDFTKRYVQSSQTICAGATNVWASSTSWGANLAGEGQCGGTTTNIMTGGPDTDWKNRTTDRSHIVGVGLTWKATEKLKTFFGYDIVSTIQNVDPVYAGRAAQNVHSTTGIAADPYNAFPASRRMTQTFRTRGEYKVLKDLTFVANYQYEKFDGGDWGWDRGIRPDNTSTFLGVNPVRNYYAHTVGAGVNYKF